MNIVEERGELIRAISSLKPENLEAQRDAILERTLRLYKHLHTLAIYDDLTGLMNSREYNTRLVQEVSRARHNNGRLSIVYMDLDNFKEFQDERGGYLGEGHQAGDKALFDVAKILRNVHTEDTIARLHGDEFAAIFPGLVAEKAVSICDRFRNEVRQLYPAIGLSAGIATYSANDDPVFPRSPDPIVAMNLLAYADVALYRAKASGKNRSVIYTEDSD